VARFRSPPWPLSLVFRCHLLAGGRPATASMRRAPGRLFQGPALAVAAAAVMVLAAGVLAVVTWTDAGAAKVRPKAATGALAPS
jgi:hypothetical protein